MRVDAQEETCERTIIRDSRPISVDWRQGRRSLESLRAAGIYETSVACNSDDETDGHAFHLRRCQCLRLGRRPYSSFPVLSISCSRQQTKCNADNHPTLFCTYTPCRPGVQQKMRLSLTHTYLLTITRLRALPTLSYTRKPHGRANYSPSLDVEV